jgi:hypothetical protein
MEVLMMEDIIYSQKLLKQIFFLSGGISSNIEFEYDLFRSYSDLKTMVDPTVSGTKLLIKAFDSFFIQGK